MKLTFYFDFWGGSAPTGYFATTAPTAKVDTAKRFAFDVVIADHLLHDVDFKAAEVSAVREIKNQPEVAK